MSSSRDGPSLLERFDAARPHRPTALGYGYQALAHFDPHAYGHCGVQESDAAVFARAAMRSPVTGIALVHGNTVRARNLRYFSLDRPRAGWRCVSSGLTFASLNDVVLSSAATLASVTETDALLRRYERLDGQRTIEVRVERITRSGHERLVMATAVDVTEEVRAAAELEVCREASIEEQRLRTVGELASGFAHDFNNTLHAMSLWIARLSQSRMEADDGRALAALSRIVEDAAVRVGQIQDFSGSRSDTPAESVSLAEVMHQAIEMCSGEMEPDPAGSWAGFRIATRIARDLPRVRGSGAELRHVFVNLFLNARDAMPKAGGGKVVVVGRRAENAVIVVVGDKGTGISEQHLGRVFDPFFTTKDHRGTGLGLAIAHQVMQRLGGSIEAENRPARGAIFRLTFPVAANAETAPTLLAATPPRRGQRVLVVDDDEDNLEATRMVLEGMGQIVTVAASGAAALEQVGEARFDLVLCDVGMPQMNGWDVAERIREIAARTPVYMVTGWANEIAPDDPHRTIVAGVIAKPIGVETLARLLGAVDGTSLRSARS